MNFDVTVKIVRASLIAACYVALTTLFGPLSFQATQVRISEALTLLPFIFPEAIPGIFIGCLVANILGGAFGLWDIILGSLASLLAAWLTSKAPNLYWAALPPVLVNAVVVGGYIAHITKTPFLLVFLQVGVGQLIACYALGIPLVRLLQRLGFVKGEEMNKTLL